MDLFLAVINDPPDVMVLDIILPTVSGLALTRLFKFDERYKHIPILVTSSITDADITEQSIKAGAEVFLPKPFQPGQLMEHLDRLLQKEPAGS